MTTASTWATPSFTRGAVDRAGRSLTRDHTTVDPVAIGRAFEVLDNWRWSHSFPLNTLQMLLRSRVKRMGVPGVIVAQRLKRTPSIVAKLRRFASMKLSRMQDIGGARAVLPTVAEVDDLRDRYRQQDRRSAHTLVAEKDYIRQPKSSGYRGIHLVYRYGSSGNPAYNGLQVEIQLRTRLQHAWATAVETVGTFLDQSLKSSEGPEGWLRFFQLAGSVFAREEGSPTAPNVPVDPATLLAETRTAAKNTRVATRLQAFGTALDVVGEEDVRSGGYVLLALNLDPDLPSLTLRPYPRQRLTAAMRDYQEQEKRLAGAHGDVVLVSSDSLASLRRAFPNYFGDTRTFVNEMRRLIGA